MEDMQVIIDNSIKELSEKIKECEYKIADYSNEIRLLNKKANGLDDPHALIPMGIKDYNEWLDNHPYPDVVKSMVFKNKREAEKVQRSSITYLENYKIVRV